MGNYEVVAKSLISIRQKRIREVRDLNEHPRIVGDILFMLEQRIFEIKRDLKKQQEKVDDLQKSGKYDPYKHNVYLVHIIENMERLRKSVVDLREILKET